MEESAAAGGRVLCVPEVRVRLRTRAPATAPQRKTRIREKNAPRSAGRGSVMLDMLALFPVTRQGDQHNVTVRAGRVIGGRVVLGDDGHRVGRGNDIALAHDQVTSESGQQQE